MIELYQQHPSARKKPVNLSEEDSWLFAHEFEKTIRATHLSDLTNVYILNDLVADLKNFRFYSSNTHIHKPRTKTLLKGLLRLTHHREFIENAVWIIDNWSVEYFHWFTDALPRLVAAKPFLANHLVVLPVHYKNYSYIVDSLAMLNYHAVYYDTNACVKVKNLLIPSHTANTGNYNKSFINELRNDFLKLYNNQPSRRIYISRKKAAKRKIKNEDDVQKLFRDYDFEIHYFEDYTFAKQVDIMSQTKLLAGLHGGGLTNMLFMQKGSSVLEFRKSNDAHQNCYFSLASDLDIDYYYQLNEGESGHAHTSDSTVDLTTLKKNLEMLCGYF